MDNETSFHFRIRVGDIEVEASGPEEYVKEVRAYAEQLVSSSLARMKTMGAVTPQRESSPVQTVDIRQTTTVPNQPLEKDESIGEFLERVPNKTHQDKILGFGYFLEKNRAFTSFGAKEINDCYEEVKESRTNTAQYLALLVKSRLIMKAKVQPPGSATQYVLTRKGEKAIEEALGSRSGA